jgi:methylmalonyl-CoA/ethylmalonyl-CoA epimerase
MSLHHIGILVRDIDQATRDYENRFGYRAVSGIIHDPEQTAYVLFMEKPGEPLIELVTPDGPDSKLSNALRKGGGLNHFCYQTDDIEKSRDDLRGQKMRILCEPVEAPAFDGRRIAWLMGLDAVPVELVEQSIDGSQR